MVKEGYRTLTTISGQALLMYSIYIHTGFRVQGSVIRCTENAIRAHNKTPTLPTGLAWSHCSHLSWSPGAYGRHQTRLDCSPLGDGFLSAVHEHLGAHHEQ